MASLPPFIGRLRQQPPVRLAVIIGLLLLLLVGAWWWFSRTEQKAAAITYTAVAMGDIEETVTAQGQLQPKQYVDVGTQVSGQLKKLYVTANDNIAAGSLVAEIDPTVYQSKVDTDQSQIKSLTAQLQQQQAQTVLARQQHQRNLLLIEQNAVSKQEVDTTAAALKAATAQEASLKAQIEAAKFALNGDMANLGFTKIYAPISGTVISTTAREGQTVNASQQAPTIVQLANLDTMSSWAQVAEADITKIKPGMPVYFTTLGSEKRWTGDVQSVLPAPVITNNVVLYNVVVDADNTSRELMSGMSTQMFFVVGSAKNVPVIPVAALGKRVAAKDNEQGEAYMVRVKGPGGQPKPTLVHVGLMSRTDAEIKSGLKQGDEVATTAAPAPAASGTGGGQRGGTRGGGFGPRL
ncbi:MAG TPA: efflux RND transporter periplasmic adaptor subunit [Alphaproteobacteria bacterium]|nr:efflux RND transporter periplasmic adaptor subunit [Alphaproteobacteria bacterium]